MTSQTLSAAAIADANPYVPPAGWTVLNDSLKVVSHAFKVAYSGNGFTCVGVASASRLTSGVIDVSFNILQANNAYGDYSGVFFLNPSGTGYFAGSNGNEFYIWTVTSYSIGSSIVHTPLIWASGDTFRIAFDTAASTINIYQVAVSNAVAVLSAGSLAYTTNMNYGFAMARTNGDACGILSATASIASSASLDSLTSPVKVGGSGYSGGTTGLGVVTSLTFGGGKAAAITGTATNSFTWSMPSFVDAVTYPAMGSQSFIAGDGTVTGTKSSTIQPSTGNSYIVGAGSVNTGAWSLGKDSAFVVGVEVHWPTSAGTINADMTLTDFIFGTYACWRRDVDGTMRAFTLTVTDSGAPTSTTKLNNISLVSVSLRSKSL